jgi:hypothetical protein
MDAHLDATPPSPAARARKTSTNTRIPRRIPQASSRLSRSVTLITPHKRLRSSGHARRLTTPPSPPPPPTTSTTPPPPRILRTRHLHPDPGRTPRLPLQDTGTTPPLPHKCEGLSDVTGYQRQRTRTPHTRGVQPRLGSEQPLCRVLPTYVTHPRPPKPPPPPPPARGQSASSTRTYASLMSGRPSPCVWGCSRTSCTTHSAARPSPHTWESAALSKGVTAVSST